MSILNGNLVTLYSQEGKKGIFKIHASLAKSEAKGWAGGGGGGGKIIEIELGRTQNDVCFV